MGAPYTDTLDSSSFISFAIPKSIILILPNFFKYNIFEGLISL